MLAVDQLNTYDVLAQRRRRLHPGRLRRVRRRHRLLERRAGHAGRDARRRDRRRRRGRDRGRGRGRGRRRGRREAGAAQGREGPAEERRRAQGLRGQGQRRLRSSTTRPTASGTTQTVAEFYFKTADDAEAAGFTRAGAAADDDRGGRQVSTLHKDHRDVLLAPVVSREELRPARRQQVHLPGAPRRQQDRDQDRGREGLRRQGHLGEHAQPPGQDAPYPQRASASARTPSAPSSASPRATASTSSEVRSPDRAPDEDE